MTETSPDAAASSRRIGLAEAAGAVLAGPGTAHLLDVQGCAAALLLQAVRRLSERPVLYVVKDSETVAHAIDDLEAIGSGTLRLPERLSPTRPVRAVWYDVAEGSPYDEVAVDRRRELMRVAALTLFLSGRRDTLVVPARALWRKCVPPNILVSRVLELVPGRALALEGTAQQLVSAGYLRTALVEDPGELAVRGGLLDVWPAGRARPVRVELDADQIVSLREFDPTTQTTERACPAVVIPPAREVLLDPQVLERARGLVQSLCDSVDTPTLKARALLESISQGRVLFGSEALLPAYYPLEALSRVVRPDTLVLFEDPSAIVASLRSARDVALAGAARESDMPRFPLDELYTSEADLLHDLGRLTTVFAHRGSLHQSSAGFASLEMLEGAPPDAPSLGAFGHHELAQAIANARQRGHDAVLDPLEARLRDWESSATLTSITARTSPQADRLAMLLGHRGLSTEIVEPGASAAGSAAARKLRIAVAPLARGAELSSDALVLLTEEEIFGKRRHRTRRKTKQPGLGLDDLRSLRVDDYVVHVEHGIGRYKGLEHRRVGDLWLDLLVVDYHGGDRLFLPVYRLNQIQRHAGGELELKLDRLGGQTFARTKAKVRRRVREMADELLRLYAERMSIKRPPLSPPDDDYRTFEAAFPFEETPDQAAAILDVLDDLGRDVVMDRLVCGDVGFGKTEVALRAAFLNAMQGRQVALLCPTTVLAQQHFLTFQARLAEYPLEVRVLSRFQSKKAATDTLQALRTGRVDVVIGTHRLLSKDVHFKRLGLLVVDEEQRFGVSHKERIKQLKRSVDVLTLSATPIPRTLQMAVSGIRDLSMISTPPVDRRTIRTVVSRLDDAMIRSAVERELARGGQVFYVYNRIEGLESRAAHLKTLLPGLRVAVAHGRQNERQLERVMLRFIAGEYDVLCSTAIVESGLDIPRANTMIIDRADLMGLSQLYQLRGRVGRSHQQAYCYLMVPPPSSMTDVARSRLEAMQRYTELGSGFQIASMDMELRGAGDLLGAEQSGTVESVGFELFCQLLGEVTQELSGETPLPDIDPELSVDVEALIPEDYVDDVGVRLSVYKRLAGAPSLEQVEAIGSELVDRFGPPPAPVRRLLALMNLKVELRQLRALGIEATSERVTLHLSPETPLSAARVGALVSAEGGRFALSPTGKLTRKAAAGERFKDGVEHAGRMLAELEKLAAASG